MASAPALKPTFEVDKAGMAMVFARKGKAFVITELIQNAWDEETTAVDVTLEHLDDHKYRIVVEDDNPEGFADLRHAYTLFAESAKKSDPLKRGRFNLGEKLVIAMCEEASIITTKGTVLFTEKGRQHLTKSRKRGSMFSGTLRLTQDEADEIEEAVHGLIPPGDVTTTFNHTKITARKPMTSFRTSLRTELSDEDGRLKPTTRKALVEIYEPREGEVPAIYEMGIPVVETGDRFHVNVGQKIPLNTDRDNVPPGYLRDIRVEVLNATFGILTPEDAKAAWVTNAMEDERVKPEAVEAAFKGKFGEKTVIFDPNDQEANKRAAAEGYAVIPGGALPKGAWAQVKGNEVALPAGKVTPSPNPNAGKDGIDYMDPDHYPEAVANVVEYAQRLAGALMGRTIKIKVATAVTGWPYLATYGGGELTLNLGRLGYKWFEPTNRASITDLIIHEFGHEYADDHLSQDYYHALTRMAGRAVEVALEQPELFVIEAGVEVAA